MNKNFSPNWLIGICAVIVILGYVLGGYIGTGLVTAGVVGVIGGFMAKKSDKENEQSSSK